MPKLLMALALLLSGAGFVWLQLRALYLPGGGDAKRSPPRAALYFLLALVAWSGAGAAIYAHADARLPASSPGVSPIWVLLILSTKYTADFEGVVSPWPRPPATERRIADETALWTTAALAQIVAGFLLLPPLSGSPFPVILSVAFGIHLVVISLMTGLARNVSRRRGDTEDTGLLRRGEWHGAFRYAVGLSILFTVFHVILRTVDSPGAYRTPTVATALLVGVGFVAHILFQTRMAMWAGAARP